jgi:N-acetylglucosamine kinase-like BadF-type ATPase
MPFLKAKGDSMNHFFKVLSTVFMPILLSATTPEPSFLYRLCIDGGGSKTALQVLNARGEIMTLSKDRRTTDHVFGDGSNINVIGEAGLLSALQNLFANVRLEDVPTKPLLLDVMPHCFLYAGMSGLGLEANREIARRLFASFGILPKNMCVMADAAMASEYAEHNSISLIAGTGSICFGRIHGQHHRVGGLGRVLGDEGSCYEIGRMAFEAALAEEYGWGKKTSLTPAIQKHFGVAELKTLIPDINAGRTPSSTLAALTPIVCEHAIAGDKRAKKIMRKTSHRLTKLVTTMIKNNLFDNARLYCWGGLFKSVFAETIIAQIKEKASLLDCSLDVKNHANDNVAVLYARSRP